MRFVSVFITTVYLSIFSCWSQVTYSVIDPTIRFNSNQSEQNKHSVEPFSGQFNYTFSFELPPSRNNWMPSVNLNYKSDSNNSPYGVGWSIDLPYIERSTKQGVPVKWASGTQPVSNLNEYDEAFGFIAHLPGGGGTLIPVANPDANTTEYRLESKGSLCRIFFKRNYNIWEVVDNNGNLIRFGEDQSLSGYQSTVQKNPSWASTTPDHKKTFRWNISSGTDTALNHITYYYWEHENYLYPYRISYNENVLLANPIPPNIFIDFTYSSAVRSDIGVNVRGGFQIKTERLLGKVEVKVKRDGQTTEETVKQYILTHSASTGSGKSLLRTLTEKSGDGSKQLPAISFEYSERQPAQNAFGPITAWGGLEAQTEGAAGDWNAPRMNFNHGESSISTMVQMLDMDGDALLDRVMADTDISNTSKSIFVQRNNGTSFSETTEWHRWREDFYEINGSSASGRYTPLEFQGSHQPTIIDPRQVYFMSLILDINGDALPDRIMSDPFDDFANFNWVKLNSGLPGTVSNGGIGNMQKTGPTSVWHPVIPSHTITFGYAGSVFAFWRDMNGDGLVDKIFNPGGNSDDDPWVVRINSGQLSETVGLSEQRQLSNSGGRPLVDMSGNGVERGLVDMNGDGILDYVYPDVDNFIPVSFMVCLGNGFGFENAQRWDVDQTFHGMVLQPWIYGVTSGSRYASCVLVDVNSDGLPDLVWAVQKPDPDNEKLFLVSFNTGSGFTDSLDEYRPILSNKLDDLGFGYIVANPNIYDVNYVDFFDINGDGAPDRVLREELTGGSYVKYDVQLNQIGKADLMKVINNGLGGKTRIDYKPSTQFDNRSKDWSVDPWSEGAKALLPLVVHVVSSVEEDDGLGNLALTAYHYKGGYFNTQRREFAGFNMVETTRPSGAKDRQWFHQGGGRDETNKGEYSDSGAFAKAGIQYRHELIDSDGILRSLTLNKVESASLYTGVYFTYVSKSVAFDYANSTDYLAKAQSLVYDTSTGNLTRQTIHGKVQFSSLVNHSWSEIETKWTDVADDEVYQHVTYHGIGGVPALANASIRNRPATLRVTTDSAGSSILKESLNEYYGDTGKLKVQRERICAGSYVTNGFKYDIYGNVQYVTNQVGIVAETVYDTHYKTLPRQNIVGSFVSYNFYEPVFGKQIGAIDLSGLVTTNILDEFYRLIETRISTTPNVPATEWLSKYSYAVGGISGGVSGNFKSEIRRDGSAGGAGHETRTYFDGLGRAVQIRTEADPQSGYTAPYRVKNLIYDDNDQVKYEVYPYFGEGNGYVAPNGGLSGSYNQYDAMERLWKATPNVDISFASGVPTSHTVPTSENMDSPTGPSTFAFVDGSNPWAVIHTDPENKVRKYYLDAHGRTNSIVEVNDGSSYTSQLQYDKLNRLFRLIDHSGNIVEWQYDDLGNRVAMSDPHLGIWKWQHDFSGRIREQTDGNGNVTKFYYKNGSGQQDPLGRLLKCEVYGRDGVLAEQINYVYDVSDDPGAFPNAPGKLIAVHDGQGWERKKYDLRGRVIKQSRYLSANTATYSIEQEYDELNRIKKITYPGGIPVVEHEYDTGANLYKVKRTDGSAYTYYTSKGYDAMGQSKGAVLGNGVETTATFYPKSKRLQRLRTFKSGTDLQNLTYQYTKAGNVNTITDNVVAHSGGAVSTISSTQYDDLHRLKSVTGPGFGTYTYSYDALGNMTQNTELSSINYTYGSVRPHAVKAANGQVFAYDQCGNMVLRGAQVLAYDARNRLSAVSSGGVSTTSFGYAHDSGRLWKQSSAGLHIWIGGLYENRYGMVSYHISANGKRVCTVEPATGNTYYLHGDHLGSSSLLTTAAGIEARHWEYNPYGRERSPNTAQSFTVSQRFTGQILDDETGLYYYNARYYDPNLARFIQADTIIPDLWNPQTYNRYAYALNNPLRYTDPSGHDPEEDGEDGDVPMTWMAGHAKIMRAAGGASAERFNKSGSELKAVATISKELVEMNPAVALYHAGYEVINKEDAIDHKVLSTGESWKSGAEGGLVLVPGALKAIRIVGKISGLASDAKKTGTVWDAIKATQPLYDGTIIPKSFELTTANSKIWVHGNASEHLAEYATGMLKRGVNKDVVKLASQLQLEGLQAAVQAATANGVPYNQLITIGGWELKFGLPKQVDQLPVLIHALPKQ